MNNPILTIAIPVYNGIHYLDKTINSILKQLINEELINKIEILLCDDASTDKSYEMAQHLLRDYKNATILKNDKNIGFDRNVNRIINKARGKFCWTLSQDDAIQQNSLTFLIQILETNPDVAYICINNQKNILLKKDAEYCKNGSEWLVKWWNGGLISQNIFNKNYLPINREKYYDNLWFHFSIALEMISNKPAILVKNLLLDSDHPCRWAKGGLAFYTFTNLKKIIENLRQFNYTEDALRPLLKGFAKDLPRTLASARLQGLPLSLKIIKILFKDFYQYPFYLTISFLVLITPLAIIKILKKLQ